MRTRRLIRQVISLDFSQHPRYGAVCPGTVLQVLILEGKCFCWRAKPAHIGGHLPARLAADGRAFQLTNRDRLQRELWR